MKLTDIKKQIILVCGKICSGKGYYCKNTYPDYRQITVSDVVRSIAKTNIRSELGQTKNLDQLIADAIIEEINKHDKVIVDGIRQISIMKRLQQEFGNQIVDIIWLDVPEETLRTRFNTRNAAKDDMDFDKAIASDNELGLSDVEQYVRSSGKVIAQNENNT